MHWTGWPLDRFIVLFTAVAYLLVGIQVTLSHYRQNFHHKAMLVPVILAPLVFICGLWLAIANLNWLFNLFVVLLSIGLLSGFVGFYYHVHGVGLRVGGYTMRNFLVGPPAILPLLFTALSVLALLSIYWR